MANLSKSEIIQSKPIGEGLNAFRDSFNSAHADIPGLSDAVEHMHINDKGETNQSDAKFFLTYTDLKNLVINLIFTLQNLPATHLLPSLNGRGVLRDDLLRFFSRASSNDFNISSVNSLLNKIINKASDADI